MTNTANALKTCENCGKEYHPRVDIQRFCRGKCKNTWHYAQVRNTNQVKHEIKTKEPDHLSMPFIAEYCKKPINPENKALLNQKSIVEREIKQQERQIEALRRQMSSCKLQIEELQAQVDAKQSIIAVIGRQIADFPLQNQ